MITSNLNPQIAVEKLVRKLSGKGITDTRVLDAFRRVPRHRFVEKALYEQAYEDNALPIGQGQTISQPYVVAFMTQLLEIGKDDKVLEIGTGSGFQAAILASMAGKVYTVERHKDLGEKAKNLLHELGYKNVFCKIGDGTLGWQQFSPYNKIVVTAGAPDIPKHLANQFAMGGILVIPTGDRGRQQLEVYRKTDQGLLQSVECDVIFVPLIGHDGWEQ